MAYDLMNDYDSALKAVKQDGLKLRLVKEEFKRDREIVLSAIKQNPLSLQFADNELRSDYEVAIEAVKRTNRAILYADYTLAYNKNFILDVISHKCNEYEDSLIKYLPKELAVDRDIILASVKKNAKEFEFADWSYKSDKEIALLAVKGDGNQLQFVSPFTKDYVELVLEAIKNDFKALKHVDMNLRKSEEFLVVLEAINPELINYVQCIENVEIANKNLRDFERQLILS